MSLLEQFMKEDSNDYRVQGSEAWHEWRGKHIGASEVPAILGECDFKNSYQLWLEKTGQSEGFKGNWATRRGTELEPIVREEYSRIKGYKVESAVCEYAPWPTLSASLDGIIPSEGIVLEIKVPSKEKHQLALSGMVPETYISQIQAQLLVTGLSKAHYCSYSPSEPEETRIAIVEVKADHVKQQEILAAAKKFWECVTTNTSPVNVVEQPELEKILTEYSYITESIDRLEKELEAVRENIKKAIKADKVTCGAWSVGWSTRKGNVDYSKVPELAGVNLDKYRKSDSRVFTIKETKNGKSSN